MLITELTKISDAPAAGQLLVYERKKVIFRSYSSIEEVIRDLSDIEILEIHLFDDKKEYRAVSSSSKRFTNGYIEHIAKFDEKEAFAEICELEKSAIEKSNSDSKKPMSKITVLNHISYDKDNGMINVDDYRLTMGGK